MQYIFLDEAYYQGANKRIIVIASWAVEQRRLNNNVAEVSDLQSRGKAPILQRVESTFDSLNAWAIVATAKLDNALFRSGEIDGTDDVPKMARSDNIWSISVIFAIGKLVRLLATNGQYLDTVDIYCDPRLLKAQLESAVAKTLRDMLAPMAKRFGDQAGLSEMKKLKIRRFEFVRKPKRNEAPSKFQLGTWLSDKLCSHPRQLLSIGGTARIKTFDMSEEIRRTLQQFEGKPFYE